MPAALANKLGTPRDIPVRGLKYLFPSRKSLPMQISQVGAACGGDGSTANYIAMQVSGAPDAFPSDEPMLRRRNHRAKAPTISLVSQSDLRISRSLCDARFRQQIPIVFMPSLYELNQSLFIDAFART
jgi:hypothetical protein